MLERIGAAVKSLVTRGKVTATAMGPRTLLQITGLDQQTQQVVELLLPPGYSARPAAGADVALLQVLGQADHVVALGGDSVGATIASLNPGEFGLTNGTQTIIVRSDHIEITSPTYVLVTTPQLRVTGSIVQGYGTGTTTDLGTHTHDGVQTGLGNTGAPNANT